MCVCVCAFFHDTMRGSIRQFTFLSGIYSSLSYVFVLIAASSLFFILGHLPRFLLIPHLISQQWIYLFKSPLALFFLFHSDCATGLTIVQNLHVNKTLLIQGLSISWNRQRTDIAKNYDIPVFLESTKMGFT